MLDSIAPYYSKFWTLGIIQILAIFSPGPDFTLVVRNTLLYSKRKGFFTVLGITFGEIIHFIYNILGINIISKIPWLLKVIGIIGGIYIIYIGINSLNAGLKYFKNKSKNNKEFYNDKLNQNISEFKAFKMGFLTNILNPKAILFFISVFSSIIDNNTSKTVMIIFCFEFIIIAFICFNIVVQLFSINLIRNIFYKNSNWVEIICGILFIIIGLTIIFG